MNPAATLATLALLSSAALETGDGLPPIWTGEQVEDWQGRAAEAAGLLASALEAEEDLNEAAKAAADILGKGSLTAARLDKAAVDADAELSRLIERVISDLRFRPTLEAEVPKGFPAPAPVGEIVLKQYPAYRLARAPMKRSSGQPFFRLFQHIQRNDIAMTAPVQTDYADGESTMAFLYANQEIEEPGVEGTVEVVDLPPMTAISIGMRGYESNKMRSQLEGALAAWLEAHADQFEVAGPMRSMGYNSPMVRGSRRFFEVEIPVRKIVKQP